MAQDTTKEFGFRLNQAVEAHPTAPEIPHGRITWLQRELEARMGVKVSLNTVHKWMNGTARPREDRVRALAKMLKVDEVWLAFGKNPTETRQQKDYRTMQATGAVLVVAGLIELNGGRVTFTGEGDTADLRANINGKDVGIICVSGLVRDGQIGFMVPEPAGDNRVLAVVPRLVDGPCARHVQLYDLTGVERHKFGGYSTVELSVGKDGLLKMPGKRKKMTPLDRIVALA